MKVLGVALVSVAVVAVIAPQCMAEGTDWSPLCGVVLTAPVSYDEQSESVAAGVDINMVMAFLNAGVTYRHWGSGEGPVLGWDGAEMSDYETTIYFGVGLLNMLQIQAGYSDSGASMRVRSDLVFFGDGHFPLLSSVYRECANGNANGEGTGEACKELRILRKGLLVSPFVEFTPFEDNHKTVYGLGIGVAF